MIDAFGPVIEQLEQGAWFLICSGRGFSNWNTGTTVVE